MVTVLLEQIIKILSGWVDSFTTWAENMFSKLGLIEEDLVDIYNDVDNIAQDTSVINSNTTLTTGYVNNIKTDTGLIFGDIRTTKNNVADIKNSVQNIDQNTGMIRLVISGFDNKLTTINTNSGITAAYIQEVATNTLNSYNRLVTMSSDTTQIRANGITTNQILTDIYDLLNGQIDYGGLHFNLLNINSAEYT